MVLFNSHLPVSDNADFLGITFDSRLTWECHFRKMEEKSQRRLNLLRVISSFLTSSNSNFMISLYKSLIHPIFEYGCMVFVSAKDVHITKLQKVQNAAIRTCLKFPAFISEDVMHDSSGLSRIHDHFKSFASKWFNAMLDSSPVINPSVVTYRAVRKIQNHPSP